MTEETSRTFCVILPFLLIRSTRTLTCWSDTVGIYVRGLILPGLFLGLLQGQWALMAGLILRVQRHAEGAEIQSVQHERHIRTDRGVRHVLTEECHELSKVRSRQATGTHASRFPEVGTMAT